jgi:hypothetical protein
MRSVSVREVPKNSLLCQGNPAKAPGRTAGGARGRVFNADVEPREANDLPS